MCRNFIQGYLCFAIIFLIIITSSNAQITGYVFRDYNNSGVKEQTASYFEPGVGGIKVSLFINSGLLSETTTDSLGQFSINTNNPGPFRIEFTGISDLDYPAPTVSDPSSSGSSVQFITENPKTVFYGIQYPLDYCKDPYLLTPCYTVGDILHPNSVTKDLSGFISWEYNNGGNTYATSVPFSQGGTAPELLELAKAKDIGTCWGAAHHRSTNQVLTTATLKRHSGLGPLGISGLYKIDRNNNNAISSWLDLSSIGIPLGTVPSNTARGIPFGLPLSSVDSLAYSLIGKVGIGAIDLSENEKTLYAVNMFDKKLYAIFVNNPLQIPTAPDVTSFEIPNPGCVNGVSRPWGIKVYRGKVYVGVVCDASQGGTTSDLSGHVYSFDPTTESFVNVLSFPLTYNSVTTNPTYQPWSDIFNPNCPPGSNVFCDYPQAILSDIVFDTDGSMIIGIIDRFGMQGGNNQPDHDGQGDYNIISTGDILRAGFNKNTNTYTLESNAKVGNNQTNGKNKSVGPGGGEYYFGEIGLNQSGVNIFEESASGSIAFCPGYQNIVTTAIHPFDFFTNGIIHLNNSTGDWVKRYQITPPDTNLTVGKSIGLGGLEICTDPAPIEIGNYVWRDLNKNGVQDPIEPPIHGISVQLLENNQIIATAITDNTGRFLFSNAKVSTLQTNTASFLYNLSAIQPFKNYILRIPSYNSQTKLNSHFVSPTQSDPSANGTARDNNGSLDVMTSHVNIPVATQACGNNNHSYDFGFFTNAPCSIAVANLTISPCNPVLNAFDIAFDVNTSNHPIGNIVVKLSTGQTKTIASNLDGLQHVSFSGIESEGIQDVQISIHFVNDTTCKVTLNAAFDQPASCCVNNYALCDNRESQLELIALPALIYYAWYDSTSNTLLGNIDKLVVDKNFHGLTDGYESYYFIGVNTEGDTIKQFCGNKVSVVECCALQISSFFQTSCDGNGTPNDASDDWFAVVVNADNPEAGPTNRYEVLYNNTVLGSSAYGAPILVGTPPIFSADGISIYNIVVRDTDDALCADSIKTTPISCPKPKIVVNKSVVSTSIVADASFIVVYKIEIKNDGDEAGTYNLVDMPNFDDDIIISAAFYTTTIPGKSGSALIGNGPYNLINNQLINPGVSHTLFLTFNVRVNVNPNSTGDNTYTACGETTNGIPSIGQGLFNRVLIDVNGDMQFDIIDTACADIPCIHLDKNIKSIKQLTLQTYEVIYNINITNLGGATATYNLIDRPAMDDDITVMSAAYTSNIGVANILSNSIPLNGWILTTNQNINPDELDSFLLRLVIKMDLSASSIGDNVYRHCQTTSSIPRTLEGIFNAAHLDLNNDGRYEYKDTVCGDLAQIMHTKELLSNTINTDGTNTLTYLIKVVNNGGAEGLYSLIDKPQFDDDVIIQNATFSLNKGINLFLSNNPGSLGWELANQNTLAGYSMDSFIVDVTISVDVAPNSPGDNQFTICLLNILGQSIAGNGIFNSSILDINGDNIPDQIDTVCTNIDFYDLALQKECLQLNPIRNGENANFRISIYNQGADIARQVVITDYLRKAYTFDAMLNTGWTIINDSTLQFIISEINVQEVKTVDLILTLKPGLSDIPTSYNEAEISSFQTSDGRPGIDVDSYPDDNRTNDNVVIPGDANDNSIVGRSKFNTSEDEDDRDIANIPIFDLALIKQVDTPAPYLIGQKIPFKITIFNQGTTIASRVLIVDYVPSGYAFHQSDNPEWSIINGRVSLNKVVEIKPTESLETRIYLELLPATNSSNWINEAEIQGATVQNLLTTVFVTADFDAENDTIQENDLGGIPNTKTDDFTNDDGLDSNNDGIVDEDDHDPAVPMIWDLALRKKLITTGFYKVNQVLSFEITVFNQGTDTAAMVGIQDYLPEGYTFDPSLNSSWNFNGATFTTKITKRINPGDSAKTQIHLKLKNTSTGNNVWINYSEIISSMNTSGINTTEYDVDSRAGSNNLTESNVIPGSPQDDNILSVDIDGEEDDHDPAMPEIFDLALKKEYLGTGPIAYNDIVTFNITIFNQGNIAANNIQLVDYIPLGYEWEENPGWVYDVPTRMATYTFTLELLPSYGIIIPMQLKVIENITNAPNAWDNLIEIKSAFVGPTDKRTEDIDSKFDMNPTNDIGGVVNSITDNHIFDDGNDTDGDGIKDEDDHDPARIPIWDMALAKRLVTQAPYVYGQTVQFNIVTFNQGNYVIDSVNIVDYLPKGFQFIGGSTNTGWTANGDMLFYIIKSIIHSGDSVVIPLYLKFLQSTGGSEDWSNRAEIKSASDTSNITNVADADGSIHNMDPDDDDQPICGEPGYSPTDEDDHDVSCIEVLDLAITKQFSGTLPIKFNQIYPYTITLYNQGNTAANAIQITDYIPVGIEWVANAGWTYNAATRMATYTHLPELLPGNSASIVVNLKIVNSTTGLTAWDNIVEIKNAIVGNSDVRIKDVDSNFDMNPNNDLGGKPNTSSDDHIVDDGKDSNEDGITDEDDHDPARTPIFDLAINKTRTGNKLYHIGDTVQFTISIFNQGNQTLKDIRICDYLSIGYAFDPALNPIWSLTENKLSCLINSSLSSGQQQNKTLILNVSAGIDTSSWNNYAEVTQAIDSTTNVIIIEDIDSKYASDSPYEREVSQYHPFNNVITGNGITENEDEDDHDVEGINVSAALGNRVWKDVDGDGFQDADEVGVGQVIVTLFSCVSNTIIKKDTTDANGYYYFDNLIPRTDYYIQFSTALIQNANCAFTLPNQLGDDTKDSDVNINGIGPCVHLDNGEIDTTYDAGLLILASIGDTVWFDANRNGIQDDLIDPFTNTNLGKELPVSNVKISLVNGNTLSIVNSTVSDLNGRYIFERLYPSNYYLKMDNSTFPDTNFEITTVNNSANDAIDSDFDPSNFCTVSTSLSSNENDLSWDGGIFRKGNLITDPCICNDTLIYGLGTDTYLFSETIEVFGTPGDVWGVIPDIDSETGYQTKDIFVVIPPDGFPTPYQASFGPIKLEELGPGHYKFTFFHQDKTGYQIVVTNGYDTLSIANKCYVAPAQNTAILPEYCVFDTTYSLKSQFPTGNTKYFFLQQGAFTFDDANDVLPALHTLSEITSINPRNYNDSDTIAILVAWFPNVSQPNGPDGMPLRACKINTIYNIAFSLDDSCLSAIGDTAWFDMNSNGVYEASEQGIAGVTVTLLYPNNTPVDTNAYGNPISPVITTNNGYYKFDQLVPGDYKVQFGDIPQFFKTLPNIGIDTKDSDADPSTGMTEIYTLAPGEYNSTVDAGFTELLNGSIGDFVWHDRNANGIQEASEEGVKGVIVKLFLKSNKTLLQTKITNTVGFYLFEEVRPAEHYVQFSLPPNWNYTIAHATADSIDSDVDGSFGPGTTPEFLLHSNEHLRTKDLGIYKCSFLDGAVWYDSNRNGIQELSENGIVGLKVYLVDVRTKQIAATTTTYQSTGGLYHEGYYKFCVKPGSYFVRFEMLSGFKNSKPFEGSNRNYDSDITNANGVWTTNTFILNSGDSIRRIGAGLYHPQFPTLTQAISNTDVHVHSTDKDEIIIEDRIDVLEIKVSLHPNPSSGVIHISTEQDNGENSSIQILDNVGKQVYYNEARIYPALTIDLSDYASGLYYLRVTSKDKTQTIPFDIIK